MPEEKEKKKIERLDDVKARRSILSKIKNDVSKTKFQTQSQRYQTIDEAGKTPTTSLPRTSCQSIESIESMESMGSTDPAQPPQSLDQRLPVQSIVGAFAIRGMDASSDHSDDLEVSEELTHEIPSSQAGHVDSQDNVDNVLPTSDANLTHSNQQNLEDEINCSRIIESIISSRSLDASSTLSEDDNQSTDVSLVPPELDFRQSNDTLAVAREIIEEDALDHDSQEIIQMASEYDPDAKPPIYRNRRFVLYSVSLGILLLVVIIITIIIVAARSADSNGETVTIDATFAPTSFRESIGIREAIEDFMQTNRFRDLKSAESKALDWIINVDPMQLLPTSKNLFQRYLLAYFYFHTSQEGPWNSCSPPVGKQRDSCTFLLYIGDSLGLYTEDNTREEYREERSVRWLSGRPECEWARVECDGSGKVYKIMLKAHKLSGTFPSEITKLSSLEQIQLPRNQLKGRLPSELAVLSSLQWINLESNYFTGTIPKQWYAVKQFQHIYVGSNKLSGTIPSEFTQLPELQELSMRNNNLNGTIPLELFTLKNLKNIHLMNNYLEGTIPTEIGLLSNSLQVLYLDNNPLTGTLPNEMGQLSRLVSMHIENTQLMGTLPDGIWSLKWLDNLFLRGNQFMGTLSTEIGQSDILTYFLIANNALSGTIPSEIGKMRKLRRLTLQGNKFTGDAPIELCGLIGPGRLREFWADCSPLENTGQPAVKCSCCTMCCNQNTSICQEMV